MFRGLFHLARIGRIVLTLARHDALFVLTQLGLPPWIERTGRWLVPPREGRPRRPGQRLADALQQLGPSFIKLGQSLATRADLLGDEFATDLSFLQDKLPPFPTKAARATIQAQLGKPVADIFQSFADRPVAAASIAQVHLAVLKDGAPVAVKILRPGIEEAFRRDLAFFRWLAAWIVRVQPAARRLKPIEVVETFAHTVTMEMDLRFEAAAASELAENFAGDERLHVPRVHWQETARRVLTTERIEGIPIDEVEALVAAGHDPTKILELSSSLFFTQVFRDGFFHADLHPGNLFVEPSGRIALVDFGIMGRLDRTTRYYLADMLLGFLNRDYRRVAEIHFEAGYVAKDQSLESFMQACRSIGEPILGLPLNQISIARLLAQLFQVTEAFRMETQPQLLLLQKSMLVAEGIGRRLNPKVNMWELARPLVEDWMRQHRGPETRLREAVEALSGALVRLPRTLTAFEATLADMARHGLRLHPETMKALGNPGGQSHERGLSWSLWLALAILVLALVVAAL